MAIVSTSNYVKFIRGTTAAFTALASKDANTLYFISDSADATSGKLYLGSKLISGGSGSSDVQSLSDLSDVVLSTIGDKQLLVYNATSGKWENKSISTLVETMTGATSSTDGKAGLVPLPPAGANNKFLRGDGTWVTLDLDADVTNGILDQVETKINTLVSRVDQLDPTDLTSRVSALETFQTTATGQLTTLETNYTSMDTRVGTLETNYTSLESRVDVVEESVKWSELTLDE